MKALLRESVAVAVVAGLVFQTLRHEVAERFVIPSGSMQPTLYGNLRGGDVVLVDRLAKAADLRRYDLGVFAPPQLGEHFVKRVVSLGDEWIELRDGDLFVGPAEQRLAREVKHPLESRDLRVPWFRWPTAGDSAASDGRGDEIDEVLSPIRAGHGPALPPFASGDEAMALCTEEERRRFGELDPKERVDAHRWLSLLRPVDASYLDTRGRRSADGRDLVVQDFGVDLRVPVAGARELLLRFDLRPDAWLLRWDLRTGSLALSRNGAAVDVPAPAAGEAAQRARIVEAPADGAVRVEFGRLDGQLFFCVDGRPDTLWTLELRPEWTRPDPGPTAWMLPSNGLSLAVVGDVPLPLQSLEVFRDLHWFRPPLDVGAPNGLARSDARHVPAGYAYLLGDNSVDSRDSRMFGPVPLASFVGRPWHVLGPWPHGRKLLR